ncbi:zinc finger protein 572-like [Anopheles cruzii]|uniref:zinc finger protein 572-like n=1 Tax=Anopheles cruzii TaxID=68878 RepID=UPI0022EC4D90|nr:zinc finger protein 572-like [Anopheles cruzii]
MLTAPASNKMSHGQCVACHIQEPGMIAIYQHPRGVDRMLYYVTEIRVEPKDQLCIPCYDELRVAHRFKQKCTHNNINRLGRLQIGGHHQHTRPDPPTHNDSLETGGETSPTMRAENPRIPSEDCVESVLSTRRRAFSEQSCPPIAMFIKSEPSVTFDSAVSLPSTPEECLNDASTSSNSAVNEYRRKQQQQQQEPDHMEMNYSAEHTIDVVKMELELSLEDIGLRAVSLSSDSVENGFENDHHEGNGGDGVPQLNGTETKCHQLEQMLRSAALPKQHQHKEHATGSKVRRDNTNAIKFRRMLSGKISALMCRYCYRECDDPESKAIHESAHLADPKPFQCSYSDCNRLFQHRSALNRHFYTHVTPKRFKCSVCPKRFHQQSSMAVHERLHRGDRPHICPQCGKGFTHLSNVKRHIRFHNGEKPYQCGQCPARFTTSTDLRRHMNSRRCMLRSLKSE